MYSRAREFRSPPGPDFHGISSGDSHALVSASRERLPSKNRRTEVGGWP
jgi:hypothetical protein